MRKKILTLLAAFLALNVMAEDGRKLTIIHTNDTHSCVMPISTNVSDTAIAGRGGFLRRITMLKEEHAKDPDLLYFDSGDFSQGSAYFTLFQGEVEVQLMNLMKPDAVAMGNHEWDAGMEGMAKFIKMAAFPVICSNIDFTGTVLEGLIKPYVIIQRKGMKIGVFALSPPLADLVDKSIYGDVKFTDAARCAAETATMLKEKEHCDMVICLSHLGWDEEGDMPMIRSSRNIDLVLGGHSHTLFKNIEYVTDADGKEVPVNQNGKSAVYVGKIIMNIE